MRYWPTLSETFVQREAAALMAAGVQVDVVAMGTRVDGVLADRLPAVEVVRPPRIPASVGLRLGARSLRAARWLARHQAPQRVARALWVGREGRRRGWDRIHAHFAGEAAEWARVAASVARIPYSVTVHASDLFRPRAAITEVLRDADPVVTIADGHKAIITERYGVESVVVRCGVELERFGGARPGSPGPLRLVCVARDVPKKGLDDLVRAVHAVPDATLRLVSDAHRLASHRVITGPLAPSRLPAVLRRAHAFVLPCRVAPDGDQDGIPVALLEAMATGLPVVTTDVSAIGELVDSEVGWCLPPEAPEALLGALREVEAQPGERERRGRAGRARLQDRDLTVRAQAAALHACWVRGTNGPALSERGC